MRDHGRNAQKGPEVSHTSAMPGGFGTVTVSGDSSGLTGVAFGGTPSKGMPPETLIPALEQLQEYFSGRRMKFDLQLSLPDGFRGDAMRAMMDIPYGKTISYSELASLAGSPGAARAAGSACARNPYVVVVPCHRVLKSDGTIGGYLYGLPTKRKLLQLEGANVSGL